MYFDHLWVNVSAFPCDIRAISSCVKTLCFYNLKIHIAMTQIVAKPWCKCAQQIAPKRWRSITSDSKEESQSFCTCRSVPDRGCNGKNKLAPHLLAMSVVCFYACNDTLNSVVRFSLPPSLNPMSHSSSSLALPGKSLGMTVRLVFFVCFGPRSGGPLDVVAFYDRIIPFFRSLFSFLFSILGAVCGCAFGRRGDRKKREKRANGGL